MSDNETAASPVRSGRKTCVHCLRRCGDLAGGYATIAGKPVCSRPTAEGRPDCYRMVTVKFHSLHDCPECLDPDADPGRPAGVARTRIPRLSSRT